MTPARRLTIVAQDPAVRVHGAILRCEVDAPQERLLPGPRGHRIAVIDYDATGGKLHRPCKIPFGCDQYRDADDESLLSDYRFHAQNVYAILMRTLARFERALGRHVGWAFGSHQLHVAPHAFQGANAYYSPRDRGIAFGSFAGRDGMVHTSL